MAEVLLFHHALGQTEGLAAFADELRAAGHTVHTPDLFEGRTFGSIAEGVGYAQEVGFDEIIARGERAASELPEELVYAGFSLGVVTAQPRILQEQLSTSALRLLKSASEGFLRHGRSCCVRRSRPARFVSRICQGSTFRSRS